MVANSLTTVCIGYIIHLIRAPLLATLLFNQLHSFYVIILKHIPEYVSSEQIMGILICVTHILCYWIINTFFYICDRFNYFKQYKIDRKDHQIPSTHLILKTLRMAIFQQSLIDPIIVWTIIIPLWIKCVPNNMLVSDCDTSMDNLWRMFVGFIICDVCNSWLFYVAHRALHHKYLYATIHKWHHEYNGPISFGAEYAHPIEKIFATLIPTFFGPIIIGAHPLQFVIWLTWRLMEAYEVHSGYVFHGSLLHKIGLTNADAVLFHDSHHTKNKGNYGRMFTDVLFGTYCNTD